MIYDMCRCCKQNMYIKRTERTKEIPIAIMDKIIKLILSSISKKINKDGRDKHLRKR